MARITPTLPSPLKEEGFADAEGEPSPLMGEGRVGVTTVRCDYHRGKRYQVTSATTPISIAKA